MSDAATNQSGVHFGWAVKLRSLAQKMLLHASKPQLVSEAAVPPMMEDHVPDLLYRIDHGFIVEETGERAKIPRFARAHLKTSIKNLG
ncbi:MAG: hypothetical protein ACSHXD_15240 [Marinosulfonomonas sp.]